MANNWLEDIVVINESRDEIVAGDILVFRSQGEACSRLEHWWVASGEGVAFTASGKRLALSVDGERKVVVTGQQTEPDGSETVLRWLQAYAAAILEARRIKAKNGHAYLSRCEELGDLPSSIEGLVAYVGFTR